MKLTLFTILFSISSSFAGGCIHPDTIIPLITGKAYVLEETQDYTHPTYLKFMESNKVQLGSTLDGMPVGEYSFRTTCKGAILIELKPFFSNENEIVYKLRPQDNDFQVLKEGKDIFLKI